MMFLSNGDLVKIPQHVLLFKEDETTFKLTEKAEVAIFVERIKQPSKFECKVLVGEEFWFLSENSICPIRG